MEGNQRKEVVKEINIYSTGDATMSANSALRFLVQAARAARKSPRVSRARKILSPSSRKVVDSRGNPSYVSIQKVVVAGPKYTKYLYVESSESRLENVQQAPEPSRACVRGECCSGESSAQVWSVYQYLSS